MGKMNGVFFLPTKVPYLHLQTLPSTTSEHVTELRLDNLESHCLPKNLSVVPHSLRPFLLPSRTAKNLHSSFWKAFQPKLLH